MAWEEVVGFKQVSQGRLGEGVAFFGMGDRVAGLPEGTFRGSIDFHMRLACSLAGLLGQGAARRAITGVD